jgi:BASS family bile acid:Na+ symporter
MLLTGISAGVVAPFIASLVRANGPLVLVMVVASSLLVPFVLPALVKLLLGRTIEISLYTMIKMLSLVIFVPVLAVETLRRLSPGAVRAVARVRYPLSLMIFAIINLGVFSRYSGFFHQEPGRIIEAALIAFALAALYFFAGILTLWHSPLEDQLASAIALGNQNNVLLIVFASEFFGPLEPTLAAMYMIPFFGLIVPLRIYRRLRQRGHVCS